VEEGVEPSVEAEDHLVEALEAGGRLVGGAQASLEGIYGGLTCVLQGRRARIRGQGSRSSKRKELQPRAILEYEPAGCCVMLT
jgi:hypothetical protein